jgi:hypothetical protein
VCSPWNDHRSTGENVDPNGERRSSDAPVLPKRQTRWLPCVVSFPNGVHRRLQTQALDIKRVAELKSSRRVQAEVGRDDCRACVIQERCVQSSRCLPSAGTARTQPESNSHPSLRARRSMRSDRCEGEQAPRFGRLPAAAARPSHQRVQWTFQFEAAEPRRLATHLQTTSPIRLDRHPPRPSSNQRESMLAQASTQAGPTTAFLCHRR